MGRSGGPLLVTGALYELPGGHLFSLDNETPFYPGRASETWRSRSDLFNDSFRLTGDLASNSYKITLDADGPTSPTSWSTCATACAGCARFRSGPSASAAASSATTRPASAPHARQGFARSRLAGVARHEAAVDGRPSLHFKHALRLWRWSTEGVWLAALAIGLPLGAAIDAGLRHLA